MKILHATGSLTRTGGGVTPVVWGLADGLARERHDVSVYGMADEFDREDWPAWRHPGIEVRTFPRRGPALLGWSPSLHAAMRAGAGTGGFDVVHQHGIWSMLSASVHGWHKRSRRPSVVAPHGMLDPWTLSYHPLRKRLFGALVEGRPLREAACIHAVCEAEVPGLREFGLRNPVAVVPNGVRLEDFSDLPSRGAAAGIPPAIADRRWVLFLSRVHPKKGLPNLLRGWAGIARDFPGWALVIAGPDQLGHRAELETLAGELGAADSVSFVGPAYGEAKRTLLGGAEVFVLPSLSEGLGIAVLEAMACGIPLLITPGCHMPEVEPRGAGLLREPTPESLAGGLRELLGMSDAARRQMGRAGRRWVGEAFALERSAAHIRSVYEWLLGGGGPPSCVAVA